MYPPELYSGPTIQSRSATCRAAWDLVKMMLMKMVEMGRRGDATDDDIDGFPASLPRASGFGYPNC